MSVKVYLEKRECFTYPCSGDYFSPHISYPEYPFSKETLSSRANEVYDMVRASLFGMGLDRENYGNEMWNPLGNYVKPNSYILLKPNFVTHTNSIGGLDCTVTHPSIIRCIIDYCVIAKAKAIEIGDAPIQNCDFDKLMNIHGYNRLFDFIKRQRVNFFISDFRKTISEVPVKGTLLQRKNSNIDDKTIEFDLKNLSHFHDISGNHKYRVANYHDSALNARHNKEHHKYLITRSVLTADLIINLPKPKTHRFAGITGAQKNFIGICSDKEYLPHYRAGIPDNGGDESNSQNKLANIISILNQQRCKYIEKRNLGMQLLYRFLMTGVKKIQKITGNGQQFTVGQWHGNDTIWRTILDLNLILLYGNTNGSLDIKSTARNILTIGDVIIAGEKSGPLEPSPKPLGIILASNNCTVFDYVFCKITGFDYNLIPSVRYSMTNEFLLKDYPNKISMYSNINDFDDVPLDSLVFPKEWKFIPNSLWADVL
ncbi:MAG: DUF362 domain-containing protein [Bacteroidales bacterium]|jgi:uncharacterized protein (DUF362 family)|nr:DUF362 domain-containing protein [Bacteroidales bacterium]